MRFHNIVQKSVFAVCISVFLFLVIGLFIYYEPMKFILDPYQWNIDYGQRYLLNGRNAMAERYFHNAIDIDPSRLLAYVKVATVLIRQERYEESSSYLSIVHGLCINETKNVDCRRVFFREGFLQLKFGNLEKAQLVFQEGIDYMPNSSRNAAYLFFGLGIVHLRSNNTPQAKLYFEKSLSLSADLEEGCLWEGISRFGILVTESKNNSAPTYLACANSQWDAIPLQEHFEYYMD